eukprot:CAMPEP_0194751392 /NCGR_PEP_ID=MMETSP0323_2-20130528/5464_1 /TAXON_ID=2866 ORGANISM="Crypthecodinium cohnii, Strain Seligo" /NCGR_SAMPLE_ID=MMETSP0323_2 /ASSEMBLY_ACC=CAM_ASM_000346 /LENGTH=99 /DNA_ID=CAMNT_0039667871 /DNA_START=206 /DNA_END=505 /DNA_ORIENTATION=+
MHEFRPGPLPCALASCSANSNNLDKVLRRASGHGSLVDDAVDAADAAARLSMNPSPNPNAGASAAPLAGTREPGQLAEAAAADVAVAAGAAAAFFRALG